MSSQNSQQGCVQCPLSTLLEEILAVLNMLIEQKKKQKKFIECSVCHLKKVLQGEKLCIDCKIGSALKEQEDEETVIVCQSCHKEYNKTEISEDGNCFECEIRLKTAERERI